MKFGIQSRLLLLTTLVLVSCLSVTGWVLERSFRASVLGGAEEQLRLVIYALMGVAEEADARLVFPETLPEPRLAQPESGLYARVIDQRGEVIWRSPSLSVSSVSDVEDLAGRGTKSAGVFAFDGHDDYFYLSYGVIWEAAQDARFTFQVISDEAPFRREILEFRRSITLGFGAVTLLFILAQFLALSWGLRPLRSMAAQIRELEAGERDRLDNSFPPELQSLANSLDDFVDHEARTRERYRKAMEDLAHSLKTPLAVLRNQLSEQPPEASELVRDQLDRMDTAVTYQLSRAKVVATARPRHAIDIAPIITRLLQAMQKAYFDKHVKVELNLPSHAKLRGDTGDLMELLGNVIENAFKYCHSKVKISVTSGAWVMIQIADDGNGVAEDYRQEVLARGARADTAQSGQGIGLAIVVDLISAYGGRLEISESDLGGALMSIELPGL